MPTGFNGAPSGWTEKEVAEISPSSRSISLQWGSVRLDGEGRREATHGCAGIRLQWGSVRLDGEGAIRAKKQELGIECFNGAPSGWTEKGGNRHSGSGRSCQLQWGSVRLDGEGGTQSGERRGPGRASMGLRPVGRRRVQELHPARAAGFRLQWGSVRLDGEGVTEPITSGDSGGFNGAPSGWTEKAPACPGPGGWHRGASMGLRPVGRRRVGKIAGAVTSLVCFNGAPSGWTEKGEIRNLRAPVALTLLQWGSVRLDGEGEDEPTEHLTPVGFNGAPSGWTEKALEVRQEPVDRLWASMGLRPVGRRRGTDAQPAQHISYASMGLRPVGRRRRPGTLTHSLTL